MTAPKILRTMGWGRWLRALPLGRPWLTLLALLLVAWLVAAACGGGGDDSAPASQSAEDSDRGERDSGRDDGDGQSADQAESDQADQSDQPRPAAPAARQSGVLRIARGEPITLDPALVSDVTSASFVVEIFGGLVSLDPDLNIIPDLAEALPTVRNNADGTVTYTFVLRRDALFQNGRRVTAADVKWSIERHAAPETLSPTAIDYIGDIVGARDYIRNQIDEIEGIQVIDERIVEITVDGPKPYFLAKLTYPTAFVVDRNQVESDPNNWTRNPNGTGPFKLAEWRLGEQIVLEPFDRYHLGPAKLDSVQIRFAGGGLTQYENDEVDIADVNVNDIESVRTPGTALNAEFVSRSELGVFYLGFNTKQPPFDDPRVRRAFGHAIDKETINTVVLQEVLPVAEGIIPPGLPGFDENFRGLSFDPDLAVQLIEDSNYAGSPLLEGIRLTISGAGATPGPVIEAIQQMWLENLGIAVEIQQVETANFFQELDRGLYQLFNIGWIVDYPDPENILDLKFFSGSRQNDADYTSDEVDALLLQARTEQNVQTRIDLYRRVEDILVNEDAVWIPLFFSQTNQVVKPYVEGYVPPRSVVPILRFITIAE